MKKLMYLFVAATMFIFTACGGGDTASDPAADTPVIEEAAPAEEAATEEAAPAAEEAAAEEAAPAEEAAAEEAAAE